MIPLSSKEFVTYTDPTDGVAFKFKPKTGALEREMFTLWDDSIGMVERMDKIDAFVDNILLEPKYSDKPSKIFNSDEKGIIIKFWNEANKLTKEEKKI